MSRIPQSFIDDLLTRLDIVDVIDRRVKLRKTGKNYSACCPFHDEKTPSFSVSPDKQFYYCFGCGASGNAVGFVMDYERQSFVDTIESLASSAGLQVPRETSEAQDQFNARRKKLYDILSDARDHFYQQLKRHPQRQQAIQYLQQRGLTGTIARDYGLGYAPPGWDNLISAIGTNEDKRGLLIDSGLVIKKDNKTYDRFRHRIMFPIRDVRGRNIGFGGRVLGDDKPKYLNSPETEVFHKGTELYGLYEAKLANKQLDAIIVVEGYMDVISLAQFNITNAVATLGTACGEDHLKLAFRHVQEVVFCFDGDAAGTKAAKRALTNSLTSMSDGRQIKFLFLPDGQDPDTLVRQVGTERFQTMIKEAVPLEEFLFDVAAENIDINSMEGRARFSTIASPMIGQLPEGIYRELMFANLAKRTGLTREVLSDLQNAKIEIVEPEPTIAPFAQQTPDESDNNNAPTTQANNSHDAPPNWSHSEVNQHQAASADSEENGHHNDTTYPADNAYPDDYENYASEGTVAYTPDYETRYQGQLKPKSGELFPPKTLLHSEHSVIKLTPARIATILLLENAALVKDIPESIQALAENKNPETARLINIINYLKKRPNSNFNNVMGFWAGAYGIEAQQELAQLLANQCFGSIKAIDTYSPKEDLLSAINLILKNNLFRSTQEEINALKSIPTGELTSEQKKRLLELITSLSRKKA